MENERTLEVILAEKDALKKQISAINKQIDGLNREIDGIITKKFCETTGLNIGDKVMFKQWDHSKEKVGILKKVIINYHFLSVYEVEISPILKDGMFGSHVVCHALGSITKIL